MNVLTIDIGGTAIKYAVMDEHCNQKKKSSIPTPQDSFENLIECLVAIYEECCSEVEGISISMPGFIDSENGYAYTGGWLTYNNEKPIAKILSERCNVNVYIENDGKCAILSEMWKGSLVQYQNAIVMLFGTGLGGGIMIDRKLYKGRHFSAGEFSYINMDTKQFGNDERMTGAACSVTGLIAMAQQRTGLHDLDGKKIFEMIHSGNQELIEVLDQFTMDIAAMIFNLNVILDIDCVALGGGISQQEILLEYVRKNVEKYFRNEMIMKCNPSIPIPEIVTCKFFNDSNLVGALYHYLLRENMLSCESC